VLAYWLRAGQDRPAHRHPVLHGPDRRDPDWHHPLLAALAQHAHGAAAGVQVPEVKAAELTDPDGRRIQQFHDRDVSLGQRGLNLVPLRSRAFS
jgi:hypothetical protein